MNKIRAFAVVILIAFAILLFGRSSSADAAYDFSDRRSFIIYMSSYYNGTESSIRSYLTEDVEFQNQYYNWFLPVQNARYDSPLKLGVDYPWLETSRTEFQFILDFKLAHMGCGSDALAERALIHQKDLGLYDKIQAEKDRVANAALKKKLNKMWNDSVLVGDANSHGILADKESTIYQRQEGNTYLGTIKGTEVSAPNLVTEKTSGATKMIMEFLCWGTYSLAYKLDAIMSGAGIALDNVIFGRVAGYGVILPGNNNDMPINLYGFELETGNPYGYVAAMLFQKFRMFAYVFMALFCFFKLIQIAIGNGYEKMKMDLGTFLLNAGLSFSFIVFMPYILDVFLYVRDIVLRAVAFKSLDEMFNTTGFLSSFQKAAEEASKIDFIPNALYLGAVFLSLFMAGIYIAYAMSMMVHFIFFPFVCVRGISDRNAFKEWASEAVGLTIMPVVDGMLLMMPLTFSQMANGNTAFNLLSLIASAMLLTARGQVRRTIGIKENGLLDMKALGTVMGLVQAAKGVAKAAGGAAKKIGGAGVDAAKGTADAIQNAKTAKAYQKMDAEGGGLDGEDHVSNPSENSGPGPQPTLVTGGGGSANPSFTEGGVGGMAAMSGGMGGAMPNLAKYANINNFDKPPFRGSLDNATMAKMYRKRARRSGLNAVSGVTKELGSAAGSFLVGAGGAAMGAAAGSFLGGNAMMGIAGVGAELGSQVGSIAGNAAYAIPRAVYYGGKGLKFIGGKMMEGERERKTAVAARALSKYDKINVDSAGDESGLIPRPSNPSFVNAPIGEARAQAVSNWLNVPGIKHEYNEALGNAYQDFSDPGAFKGDSDMQEMVRKVNEKIIHLKEKKMLGEANFDELMNGGGGLNSLMNEFDAYKVSRLYGRMVDNLEGSPNFSKANCTDTDTALTLLQGATKQGKDGKAGWLRKKDSGFLTKDFDNSIGIDWKRAIAGIRTDYQRH